MKKDKQSHKTSFIKIANCIIRIDYTDKTKIISLLKDFFVYNNKNYDYLIRFYTNKRVSSKRNFQKNTIIFPREINIHIFQYFLRNILQDYFGKTRNGFFLHCSGVYVGDNAYLFLGTQGSGKSTISKMLMDIAPTLADDSGIIVKEGNSFYFYQTPFMEKKWFKKSMEKFHINKIFFIKKAKFCKERELDRKKVLDLFIKQLWTDQKRLDIQVKILMRFVNSVNQFYQLDFPKNKEVVVSWFTKFAKLPISNYGRAHHQQNNYDIFL